MQSKSLRRRLIPVFVMTLCSTTWLLRAEPESSTPEASPTKMPKAPTTKVTAVLGGPSSQASAADPFPATTPQAVVAVTAKIFPPVVAIDFAAVTFTVRQRDL